MLNFFQKKDPRGNGLSVYVFAILLFGLPFIVTILQEIEMENEVEAWLPERDPQAVLLDWYGNHFPLKDRMFVSWEGSVVNDPRAELLAARLEGYVDENGVERRGSPYIEDVLTPRESLREFLRQGIEEEQARETLSGLMIGHGALKVRLTELGREKQETIRKEIVTTLKEQLKLDTWILPAVKSWQPPLEYDQYADIQQRRPEGEEIYEEDEKRLDEIIQIPEHDFQVAWHLMKPGDGRSTKVRQIVEAITSHPSEEYPEGDPLIEDSFFHDGAPIALVVTLTDAGQADRAAALADVTAVAEESFIPSEDVHMGGRPVGSAVLNEEVSKSMWNPEAPFYKRSVIGLSAFASFMLAFVMLRSLRLGLLVLVVAGYATALTVTLVPLTGSTMNMVLITMPTLLSVLTLSGAIHLASYWKHTARKEPKNAIVNAVKMASQPCFLASATTAIGLASLTTSTLNPVRDFGLFAAIGCGFSLFFILFVQPALMQLWPGRPPVERESDGRGWQLFAHAIYRHSTLVSLFCLGLFAFGVYGLRYFQSETKVIYYFDQDAPIVEDYWFLEDHVVGINTVDTVVRFDKSAQEEMRFLERLEVVRQIMNKIREHDQITGVLSLASFQEPTEKPDDEAPVFTRMGYNRRSNAFEEKVKEGEITEARALLTVDEKGADQTLSEGEPLSSKGDELWRISAQAYVMADNDYGDLMSELDTISQSVLKFHVGTNHVVTGMVPVFLRTQEALLESLIRSFALAFGIIAVVLIIVLRNPLAGVLTMLPNLLPVVLCFGTLSFMGQRVDIGTMITASVALGIAIDGTLHLLTWFRQGLMDGLSRRDAVELGMAHCAPALCQTSGIVALGLLMLAPAPLLMISRFGILMAALVTAALVADIIFLPALLAGWLGTIIEKGISNPLASPTNQAREEASPEADSSENEEDSSRNSVGSPHLDVASSHVTESSGHK